MSGEQNQSEIRDSSKRIALIDALWSAVALTYISAFLYLIGWSYLNGEYDTFGVNVSLLGLSAQEIMAYSFFPVFGGVITVSSWCFLFVPALVVSIAVPRTRAVLNKADKWLAEKRSPVRLIALLLAPSLIFIVVMAAYIQGHSVSERIWKGGQLKRVHVSLKPTVSTPDKEALTEASNHNRLLSLAETRDLLLVIEKVSDRSAKLYIISRSDVSSSQTDIDLSGTQ